MKPIRSALAATLVALAALAAVPALRGQPTVAQASSGPAPASVDAMLRKNLAERVPNLGKIDEITRTPMNGMYEVRVGTELFYTDAEGNYVLNGQMLDTRQKKNLTEERLDKLLAIDFDALPIKDAFTIVRGNGKRKLAVFEDPNCGYCKKFERDLQKVDNVTVHMFLLPILGADSADKSRNIWCARDKGKAWMDWMTRDQAAPRAESGCDVTALARNIDFARKYNISGTPTLFFANGTRVPGMIPAAEVEKLLAAK
ncbi:DsbC family protein [Caenimonas sedimenti]|uniref:Thiol:disulfide interchange protein n=1 Tax=Caenimonas sedimenti TaxID=2596921 RepID=A0A562ZPZ8_9BURK|nr:DsbC family protein [Caenimonas sedimenti]TWO70441.1 DsbC family protein [Caenimonas sedimenti]